MNVEITEIIQGSIIEILEMNLGQADNRLVFSWRICSGNTRFRMTFLNVSRFRVGEMSSPLEIHGFEMIDHSQGGWEKDSKYEIRDFEANRIHFFCEDFRMVMDSEDDASQ